MVVIKMKNTEEFLDNLYDEYKDIDGIECYYYDFTKNQIDYIKDFAKKEFYVYHADPMYPSHKEKRNVEILSFSSN